MLTVPVSHQIALLLSSTIICTLIAGYYDNEFTVFYIMWTVWVLIRRYAYHYDRSKLNSVPLIAIILLCAFLSAIKLNHFHDIKQTETHNSLIKQFETPNDVTADYTFKK